MTALDWAIVSIVAASVLLGLLRGLLREVLSLAAWVVGAWLAFVHASTLGAWLPWDLWPAAKTALAALAIVAGCVLLAGLVAWAGGSCWRRSSCRAWTGCSVPPSVWPALR